MPLPGIEEVHPNTDARHAASTAQPCGQTPRRGGLTLRSNFLWTLTGNVVYAACQWGMLVAFAKLGTPEMVGRFALGLAITAPIIMLSSLQLRGVQATDAKGDYAFADYLSLRLFTTVLAVAVIVVVACVTHHRWETTMVILMVGVAKAFENVSDVFYGLLQQRERMDRIAISMIIKGVVSLVALVAGVFITHSVLWGTVGLAVVWALVLICYDIPSGAYILRSAPFGRTGEDGKVTYETQLRTRWDRKTLAKLGWLSLPMGIVMMMLSLNANMPRYFIEHYMGERELGIFSALFYLVTAETMVVQALAQSASPRLAKHFVEGQVALFRRLLLRLVGIGALIGAVGILVAVVAGRQILSVLYRPEYAARQDVLVWLMLAAAVSVTGTFVGTSVTSMRHFKVQLLIHSLVTALTWALCLALIKSRGLVGAAQVCFAVNLFSLVAYSFVSMWHINKAAARRKAQSAQTG